MVIPGAKRRRKRRAERKNKHMCVVSNCKIIPYRCEINLDNKYCILFI